MSDWLGVKPGWRRTPTSLGVRIALEDAPLRGALKSVLADATPLQLVHNDFVMRQHRDTEAGSVFCAFLGM